MAALAVLVSAGVPLVQALRSPRGEAPADAKAPVDFRALADQPWQDAGVDVVEGEAVVLAPKGVWRKGKQTCSAGGLEQAPRDRAVWPEAPLLCLLVRIGDEPTPTAVRQREVFKPRRSGRLFVQANDLDLQGNSDALQLTITGGLCLGDAAPRPELLPIQAAERDWKPIVARTQDPGANPDQVREAVFDFCQKYAGTPHAASAARWLQTMPPVTNSLGMKLALIPPGEFMMGSDAMDGDAYDHEFVDKAAGRMEKHRVRITRPFYLSVTELTRGQFRQFVDDAGYKTDAEKEGSEFTWRDPHFEQTDEHPVVYVSWNDAVAFCDWLSRKEGKTYRLPTEAEWEYACRAATTSRYSCGDDPEGLPAVGNVLDATASEKSSDFPDISYVPPSAPITARDGYVYTAPVGRFQPNAWGLFDMHGNVWEWCADWYGTGYYKQSPLDDPPGPGGASARVARGGGWRYGFRLARSAYRGGQPASYKDWNMGFRVALVPRTWSHPAWVAGISGVVRKGRRLGVEVRHLGGWSVMEWRIPCIGPGHRRSGVAGHLAHDADQRALVHVVAAVDRLASCAPSRSGPSARRGRDRCGGPCNSRCSCRRSWQLPRWQVPLVPMMMSVRIAIARSWVRHRA